MNSENRISILIKYLLYVIDCGFIWIIEIVVQYTIPVFLFDVIFIKITVFEFKASVNNFVCAREYRLKVNQE